MPRCMYNVIQNYSTEQILCFRAMFFLGVLILFLSIYAEKTLVYDEEKGIIFLEKDAYKPKKEEKKDIDAKKQDVKTIQNRGSTDIHLHREKDPPELYFKSGLEYYKNEDYKNALKNFKYASDREIKPKYLLWIGKTYRQLDKSIQFFSVLERIVKDYPESDVADDALFEMAFYYQKTDDYRMAIQIYKQLTEQYPFGTSFSNREEFLDVSRREIRRMRGEMISSLKLLGIQGETLSDAYKIFQKANSLKVTGEGDSQTVKAIKAKYNEKLMEDKMAADLTKRFKKSIQFAGILFVIFVVCCTIHLNMLLKVIQNRKQLSLLNEMLSDLD